MGYTCVLQCMLQCVAVCVAVCVGLRHPVREFHMIVLQCVAVCCSVLQCVAVSCSVLQCVAVCFTGNDLTCVTHVTHVICELVALLKAR